MGALLILDDERRIEVSSAQLVFGRSAQSGVSYPERQELAPEHARLKRVGNRWLLESLSSSLILVDGQPPARMHWLKDGDRVLLTDRGPSFSFYAKQPGEAKLVPPEAAMAATQASGSGVSLVAPNAATTRNHAERGFARDLRFWLVIAGAVILLAAIGFTLSNGRHGSDDVANKPPSPDAGTAESATPVPAQETHFSVDQRLVWIGFENDGVRFSYCNGWMLDSRNVVTWARGASSLQQRFANTNRVFIQSALGRQQATVSSYRYHPQFNSAVPNSPASMQFDLAVLGVSSELVPGLPRIAPNILEPRQLRPGAQVELATCQLPGTSDEQQPIDATNTPPVVYSQVSVLGVVAVANTRIPVLELGVLPAEGIEGTPVIDSSGHIVATITRADPNNVSAVPIDRLETLMESR